MTWLTPTYAIIAASIAVPTLVILYFLKLRRRDLEVSTTLLWKKSIQDLQANAPFQKLRKNLLLFLQLLALAGIIGALGQLTMKGQNVIGNKHVILIDRSGSMAALDEDDNGNPVSRLDAAKKQAIALVESLGEGNMFNRSTADEAMVISFAGGGDVRQQFTNDKAALKTAIESITISEGPTSLEEAMRLAMAHKPKRVVEGNAVEGLTVGAPVTMHLYTDGKLPDADKARPDPDDTVMYHHVGRENATNLGITGLRSERNYDDPAKLSIFVAVQNADRQDRVVDIEMLIDGTVAGIRSTTIPGASSTELSASAAAQAEAREREAAAAAGAPAATPRPDDEKKEAPAAKITPGVGGVVFQLERGGGALVQVRLRSSGTGEPLEGDVLSTDDRAWLVVPPAKKMAVAIVGRTDLFITSALGGLPLSRLDQKTPAEFEELVRQNRVGEYDVIILNGWVPTTEVASNVPPASPPTGTTPTPATADAAKLVPPGPRLTTALPPGRYLMLGVVPPGLGITDKGPGPAAAVIDWNRDHPALRVANISSVNIAASRQIEVSRELGAESLATADNGPMIVEVTTNDLRSIVVPFDPAESDWPFKPSFVLFLASTINYLGEDVFNTAGRMLLPGRELSDRLPVGARNITVKPPGDDAQPLTAASDGRIVFGPIEKTGVYDVTWEGPAGPTDLEDGSGRVLRSYVCNMLDPNESDLAAAKTIMLANDEVKQETKRSAEADKRLWPWFLLAALGVVMFEWFIYNRKVYL
ncbi:MAG TPA: VWA domain-containing protein [Phycisphaerales bacterium]|nr:VWA domain-containing protein [Phycisphaerales bacterium]